MGLLAYMSTPSMKAKLKQVFTNATYGEIPVWTGETMNGYTAYATNNVPSTLTKGASDDCHAIVYGNWPDLVVGMWGNGVELIVDPYTNFASGGVQIRVLVDFDIDVKHAASFAACIDARDV